MEHRRFITFFIAVSCSMFLINYLFLPEKIESRKEALHQENRQAATLEIEPIKESGGEEAFYLLETDSLQLLFSDRDASIVEINLPLNTISSKSLVRGVEVDQEVVASAPREALFPKVNQYYLPGMKEKKAEQPLPQVTRYYPLLRRSMQENHRSMVVLSDSNELSHTRFKVEAFTDRSITFIADYEKGVIRKHFWIDPKLPYLFHLKVEMEGEPITGYLSSGFLEAEPSSGSTTAAIKYFTRSREKEEAISLSLPKQLSTYSSLGYEWVSNSNGYFGLIIQPKKPLIGLKSQSIPGEELPPRISLVDPTASPYPSHKYPSYQVMLPLQAGEYQIFAGPYQESLLNTIGNESIQAKNFQGWFATIAKPFSKLLFWILLFCQQATGSWGFSIILLTLILRLALYPLNSWAIRSQMKNQEIAPLIKKIQEKYKKEPMKMNSEVMKLYKESGTNPFLGCLPLLIQIPFMVGIFDLLRSTYELRGIPFIPGWIDNLTAPDTLFSWGYSLPFIGKSLHLLPLIVAAITLWQQKLSSNLPKDPKEWSEQQKQQHMMSYMMILVFLCIFYHFPAGMNIYWIFSSLFAIVQQTLFTKRTQILQQRAK